MSSRLYTLRHSHRLFTSAHRYYKKNWKSLSPPILHRLETALEKLEREIAAGHRQEADQLAREVELIGKDHFKRSVGGYLFEIFVAVVVALAIATVIRQVWFEPYKIPTGSMRPTFRELDHLTVTKTQFGINTPLQTSHLMFDPSLMRRNGIVIFSADGLDMADTESTYFWIFPAKKRLVKRTLGLPGDTVYFYGGKIYGMDEAGRDITEELNPPYLNNIDHIPMISYEGRISVETLDEAGRVRQLTLKQMNQPVGRLRVSGSGTFEGQVFNGDWVVDRPLMAEEPHNKIETYSDVLGMRNFAQARLLTADQLKMVTDLDPEKIGDGLLYLVLHHTPSLTYPTPRIQRGGDGRLRLFLPTHVTALPLTESHLQKLRHYLYTVRFVVKDGRATAYSADGSRFTESSPRFPGIPDGTYEFYNGKGYKVWLGITSELPADHPLNQMTPERMQKLFNVGINMERAFEPHDKEQIDIPSRFAYFRDDALYVMGGPVFTSDDPLLKAFNEKELQREKEASKNRPYIAFRDHGAPYREGQLDQEFMSSFGIKIPPRHYLMLGDNHARSGDSRDFGFVPEDNIQGRPSLILWPPGPRFGAPPQTHYAILTLSRVIIWIFATIILVIWWLINRWRMHRITFKKLS